MPEMDSSPQISGVLEQGSSPTPTSTVVRGLHLTKRPREEGSPLATLGKRGRGENGDVSLTLQIPVPAPLLPPSGGGGGANRSPPAAPAAPQARPQAALPLPPHHTHHPPPPLCESPGKTNQAPRNLSPSASSSSNSFAPFSGGGGGAADGGGDVDGGVESAAKSGAAVLASPSAACASTPEALSGEPAFPTARRKYQHAPCTPHAVAGAGVAAAAAAAAAAKPSLGATDPIFHAALLRLWHRRGGNACPEASAWRWRGSVSASARFEHWPRALHPSVMDLLACVSAGEERLVLTGCDMKKDACGEVDSPPTPQQQPQQQQPPREAAAWRAPRPRTPARRGAAGTPLAHTPIAPSSLQQASAAQTPLSALRRPGSACRSANRVRFSTHDMSVVDTPDPLRGGSEEGMVSALDGLESILSAAEKVRGIAASASDAAAGAAAPAWGSCGRSGGRGSSVGGGDGKGISCRLSPEGSSSARGRHFEGYFDRFSSAGSRPDVAAAAAAAPAAVAAAPAVATEASGATGSEEARGAEDGGMGQAIGDESARPDEEEEEEQQEQESGVRGAEAAGGIGGEGAEEAEARSVREDAVALAGVLEEIASSDSAPEEVALTGGWGPEHSNAAAFYAKEVALLCGAGAGGEAQVTPGVAGSHLRVRYLDVLSSLVRYNLKLLLNLCVCDIPEAAESVEEESSLSQESDGDDAPIHDFENPNDSDDDGGGDSDCGDMFAASPTLTVVVPGRASLFREEGVPSSVAAAGVAGVAASAAGVAASAAGVAAAGVGATDAYRLSVTTQGGRGCGCVTVLDGTGALEFNTEDVAALLTLALGRMHPFMPLAARLASAAEGVASGGGRGGGRGDGDSESGGDEEDGEVDGEEVDARVWAAVQKYALECRTATATAAAEAAAAATAATAAAASGAEASGSDSSRTDLFSAARPGCEAGTETPGCGVAKAAAQELAKANAAASSTAAVSTAGAASTTVAAEAALTATAITATASSSVPGGGGEASCEESSALTVDEAADLLEYVAAARFVAQLIAEPVVADGIAAGRWAGTERLAGQVQKLAEEEEEAATAAAMAAATGGAGAGVVVEAEQRVVGAGVGAVGAVVGAVGAGAGVGALGAGSGVGALGAGAGVGAGGAGASVRAEVGVCVATRHAGGGASLSNMLCLGALADVRELGVRMAQQARYAPALEAVLRGELRRALRRGQGSKKRRIRNRMQQGAPDVFSFPMITPCCCFVPAGAI